MNEAPFQVIRLQNSHDRTQFKSGAEPLDILRVAGRQGVGTVGARLKLDKVVHVEVQRG